MRGAHLEFVKCVVKTHRGCDQDGAGYSLRCARATLALGEILPSSLLGFPVSASIAGLVQAVDCRLHVGRAGFAVRRKSKRGTNRNPVRATLDLVLGARVTRGIIDARVAGCILCGGRNGYTVPHRLMPSNKSAICILAAQLLSSAWPRNVGNVGVVGRELLGAPRTAKMRSFMMIFIATRSL